MRKDRLIGVGLVAALAVLVGVGLWKTGGRTDRGAVRVSRRCEAVMGTRCELAVIVPAHRQAEAEACLREAEATLRTLEARLSTWITLSEMSQLNAAPAGQLVELSPDTLDVLRAAKTAHEQTGGAFDVTCRPLVELWREAAERGVVPDDAELANARDASGWQQIDLTDDGARKLSGTARVDVDGIAKGLAIDRAAEVLRDAGVDGGWVEIGGDLACFGSPSDGQTWTVGVRNPFGPGKLAELRLPGGSVCTSGDYARPIEIAGRHYSHILDPRTGQPVAAVPSVTVVSDAAMTADVWATALSVLGTEGLPRLPEGAEAMIVLGTPEQHAIYCTPGLFELLVEPPQGVEIVPGK